MVFSTTRRRTKLAEVVLAGAIAAIPLVALRVPASAEPVDRETVLSHIREGLLIECDQPEWRDDREIQDACARVRWAIKQRQQQQRDLDWANDLNNPANPMSPLNPNNPANPNYPGNRFTPPPLPPTITPHPTNKPIPTGDPAPTPPPAPAPTPAPAPAPAPAPIPAPAPAPGARTS
ncbi:hypothetical protein [Nocardia sp. NPDC052566]|uniref:hypothetical protein n=1 Tax=Nocardia sp. NPDC052566 TaxID=3364330 RepID=UPI0037C5E14F